MYSVHKEEKIPLQTQRLMIFMAICRKAQAKPNRIVHLSCPNKLAFGVIYIYRKLGAILLMVAYLNMRTRAKRSLNRELIN